MCLGVPGKIVEVHEDPTGMTMGKVSFSGIFKEVCLAYIEEPEVGDYVVVHVGFAISKIDEEQANEVFEYLRSMGELEDLDVAQPGAASPTVGTPGSS